MPCRHAWLKFLPYEYGPSMGRLLARQGRLERKHVVSLWQARHGAPTELVHGHWLELAFITRAIERSHSASAENTSPRAPEHPIRRMHELVG